MQDMFAFTGRTLYAALRPVDSAASARQHGEPGPRVVRGHRIHRLAVREFPDVDPPIVSVSDRLQTEQRVTFRVASLPGREFIGTVDFIDPTVQLPGRTIMVKAQVANPKRELQSGMFIEARPATAMRPSAVIVPEGETVVVGGQERLAEGAPVAPKLIQRAPVPGGEESASVGAR
jgi:hypothetical protein